MAIVFGLNLAPSESRAFQANTFLLQIRYNARHNTACEDFASPPDKQKNRPQRSDSRTIELLNRTQDATLPQALY
jgi:hypothetical protein